MFKDVQLFYIKAITPIHAGSGRELGLIDMPIQKEQHTGIPKIEGSTVKGCFREVHRCSEKGSGTHVDNIEILFGPEKGDSQAGLLGFTDAKLLLYPFISVGHIFAYVTCPYLINRYMDDNLLLDKAKELTQKYIELQEGKFIPITYHNKLEHIILNEYKFTKVNNEDASIKQIEKHLQKINLTKPVVIISDVDFIEMVTLCKEVITRNRINHETGTVDKNEGGLFTEEYLPAESVLYSLLLKNGIRTEDDIYTDYWNNLPKYAQFGGNATIGKGLVQLYKGGHQVAES